MPFARRIAAAIACLSLSTAFAVRSPAAPLAPDDEARAWVHRNLGIAYFANDAFADASRELSAAWEVSGDDRVDARNAGVAALLAGNLDAARTALDAARIAAPDSPELLYAIGILDKRAGRLEESREALLACRAAGGNGPELHYNLGILGVRLHDLDTAVTEFSAIVGLGEVHAPRHYASALYRYGRTLLQMQRRDEGAAALRQYQELVKAGAGAQLSEEDLEMGAMLELTRIARPAHVRAAGTLPAFRSEPLAGVNVLRWADVADLDRDGDRDLLVGDGQTLRDLRWTNDGWEDVTDSRGLAGLLGVGSARALDLDNDGQRDLVRAGGRGLQFHPGVEGAWDPPLPLYSLPVSAWIPVDFDHEGDVDIAAVQGGRAVLVRNNGDRTFTDVTEDSGFAGAPPVSDVVAADFDDDQDVDFAFVTRRGQIVIASNLRGGKFEFLPPIESSPGGSVGLEAADLDNDGDVDLAVAASRGVFVMENRGALELAGAPDPALAVTVRWPTGGGRGLWVADLDNDGRLDLLAATETGALLGMNDGDGGFASTDAPLEPLASAGVQPVAVAAVDGDGRLDLLTTTGAFGIARNIGETGHAVVLEPVGVKNNRDGVGAIVEMLRGSRYARATCDGHAVHFGLGDAERADALRIRWPNGIQQGVLEAATDAVTPVEEKAGLVGSCPFLYTWNGRTHEFVTDILTVTPLGLPIMPGMYVPPNWDEAIRVTADQMMPTDDGYLVAQVTEELREVTYLDQVRLYAIDHPAGVEVQPNEKFKFPPFPEFGVHVLDGARPPEHATDHEGRDVTETLLFTDGIVVGDLPLTRYQGITGRHELVMDFGTVPPDAPLTLHLSGWFHWTNASINIALSQDPRMDFIPPQLEVLSPAGEWKPFPVEVGFPGGKTKSIPVDLTGAFPDGRAVVRVWTTLRLYWDRALLQVEESPVKPRVTMLLPDDADLHFRGHSEPIFSITGEEPERFDYDVPRKTDVPWNQHPGMYTRYGDVTPLLQEPEDMYAILASGDECTVRWKADRLPELPEGFTRTYFLVFDGWAKDGDLNATLSDRVGPLPFHAMSGYPYGTDESYPADEAHAAYQAEWNTRPARPLARDLVAEAAAAPAPAAEAPQTR